MPTGSKGRRVASKRIASAPAKSDDRPEKDEAAAALGRKGGPARAKALTPERRSEIARKAAKARWARD